MMWGHCLLLSFCRYQRFLALSSGEAEYDQLVTAGAEAIVMKGILTFFVFDIQILTKSDSTVALGV